MKHDQGTPPHAIGHFKFVVFGAGRSGRQLASQFQVRCDAIALHDDEILLLSIVGPETSVKALTAGLRGSRKEQQRLAYSVALADFNRTDLVRCPDGYRIHRTRLEYGLWHVLCLANREGSMPIMTEETL